MNIQNSNQFNMYYGYQSMNNQYYNQNQNTLVNNQMNNQSQINYPYNQGYINVPNNYMQNQNMMAMNQNFPNQNMMTMSQMNNQNMMSLSANSWNSFIKPKNSSLIRVLQCLYVCFEDIGPIDNLKNMIKSLFQYKNKPSITLNILDCLSSSFNPDNNFINLVVNLRNNINALTNLFPKNEEVSPNLIFFYIIKIINDEYINEQTPYFNGVFEGLKTIEKIPQYSLLLILGKINEFKQNTSLCYNNFYYLFLDIIKCPSCKSILAVNDKSLYASNFIGLQGGMAGSVSNLIQYYMKDECDYISPSYTCKCGKNEGLEKPEKALLNTPKYLFIDFEGETKKQRQLDEK